MKGTDEEAKAVDGKVQANFKKASLFVRKVAVTDSVILSIEKPLVKRPAIYLYTEILIKSFIIQTGHKCFLEENLFGTESIRQITFCMVKNSLPCSTPMNHLDFSYQKVDVQRVEVQSGNGVPLAGTPLDTSNNFHLYYNTINRSLVRRKWKRDKIGGF